jgi:group I intron endonuclease
VHFIYKIYNNINSKVYIGQTNNPTRRWSQHKSSAKYNHTKLIISRAIIKYGIENFNFTILASCRSQEDVDSTEIELINQYNSRNPASGYNLDPGGNSSPRTEKVRNNISTALQKYYKNNDNWNKGNHLSNEWKNNISKSSMGKKGTNLDKKFDDEWRLNISKSRVGKDNITTRRFPEEIEKEICRLYIEEEKSMYNLGKQFDCNRSLISDILIRNNIEKRKSNYNMKSNKNKFTEEQEKEICKIYKEGKVSRRELAKMFNCGKTTIRKILIRNNIKS